METNQISASVVDAALWVHRELGPGLLESVYEVVLADLLPEQGLSVESLARVHQKQVLTYLRLADLKVGLRINFGGELLKGNIERIVIGEAPDLRKGASTRE